METIKKFVYIGMFAVLFSASERAIGSNNQNHIGLSLDSIIVSSQYIENELDSCLGYYDLKIEKNDSTQVLTGLYIKRESGLFLGVSASSVITKSNIQDYCHGISAVLSYISIYEAIEKLECMQIDIPYDIAVEVRKLFSSNQKWRVKKERIKKCISSSYFIVELNECLKDYSLQIVDISLGHIFSKDVPSIIELPKNAPRRLVEIELFLIISQITR
jgi:hypothetical protein